MCQELGLYMYTSYARGFVVSSSNVKSYRKCLHSSLCSWTAELYFMPCPALLNLPFFFGPLQTTASSLLPSKNPIDITDRRCSLSAYTGTHLSNKTQKWVMHMTIITGAARAFLTRPRQKWGTFEEKYLKNYGNLRKNEECGTFAHPGLWGWLHPCHYLDSYNVFSYKLISIA